MDTLRGNFGLPDANDTGDGSDEREWDSGEDETGRELPPASIGTDERRMQVRAYNHWAGLLDERSFPSIEDLEPAELNDFGPFSVLLDFSTGIEDPAIQYLGAELAAECGTDGRIQRLSDIPSRSLLSRITDHYLQILANQAPIGFEAEFVNQREATILYRGILLPYSSDGETIDFIYGVINWKEMADQITSDELLLEIGQALDEGLEEDEPGYPVADNGQVSDWADGPGGAISDLPQAETTGSWDNPYPEPEFGSGGRLEDPAEDDHKTYAVDYGDNTEEDEIYDEDEAVVARLASLIQPRATSSYGTGFDDDCEDEEEAGVSPAWDGFTARSPRVHKKQALPAPNLAEFDAAQPEEFAPDVLQMPEAAAELADAQFELNPDFAAGDESAQAAFDDEPATLTTDPDAGLYDCLAEARELALAARSSEDRTRGALYAAVSRAYDVCLAADEDPEGFGELVAESGLSVQDRAPMTPVVKLVFGVDYDKSRIAEYASVLAHARRHAIARGELAGFLSSAEGGLKGVVQAERRLRKEESGKMAAPADRVRPALAKKLRQLETRQFDALDADGDEFGVVLIRRLDDGSVVMLGEVVGDIPLIEKVARKLV